MKKLLTALFPLLLICTTLNAQLQKADSTTEIKSCGETITYSVEDINLKSSVGNKVTGPDVNPSFKGGIDELKKYFALHPLKDARAKEIVFRVHVGFLVNCNGEAGNFQLLSKGKNDLQDLAQQVLATIKNMPQNWQAATVNNKEVDSYQILSFTVVGGALDKVSYR